MAAKKSESSSQQPPDSRSALPFEPTKSRKQVDEKQSAKKAKQAAAVKKPTSDKTEAAKKAERILKKTDKKEQSTKTATLTQSAIPDAVSKRMIKRMALFSGIPTALGMSSFLVSYFAVSNAWVDLPTVAVLVISLGFFGLGVLGLSYGVLSTSWDEDRAGGLLGWSEFTTNFGRMTQAWRSARQHSKTNR